MAGIASLAIGVAVGSTTYLLTGIPKSNVNPSYWEQSVSQAKAQRAAALIRLKEELKFSNYFTHSNALKAIRSPAHFYLPGVIVVSPSETISDRINLAYQQRIDSARLVNELYSGQSRTLNGPDAKLMYAISDLISKLKDEKIHKEDVEIIRGALVDYRRNMGIAFGGAATVGSAVVGSFGLALQGMGRYKDEKS